MSFYHALYGKGGDNHGEVQTLLWKNSTPKNVFDAQKISIDLTNYEGVIIEYYASANSSEQTIVSRVKLEKNITYPWGSGYRSGSENFTRNITAVDDTGVTFDNAWTASADGSVLIPYKIYGYKQYKDDIVQPVTFNYILSNRTNASESIFLYTKTTAPLDGYYKRSNIVGFQNATSNLTTEFKQLSAGDEITLTVTKSSGVQDECYMTIYYSKTGE